MKHYPLADAFFAIFGMRRVEPEPEDYEWTINDDNEFEIVNKILDDEEARDNRNQ